MSLIAVILFFICFCLTEYPISSLRIHNFSHPEIDSSTNLKVMSPSAQNFNTEDDIRIHPKMRHLQNINPQPNRYKRSAEKYVLELAIFSDKPFHQYIKSRYRGVSSSQLEIIKEQIIIALVSSVQIYFDHPSFELDFEIKLVKLEEIQPQKLSPTNDIQRYIDRFCSFQKRLKRKRKEKWDHALLLTGLDLYSNGVPDSSGMAFLSGMCSEDASCTIAESRSLGATALIIAHELAHNLGSDHDGYAQSSDCDFNDYIMGPKLSPGVTDWSSCTSRQIHNFLEHLKSFPNGRCLQETSQHKQQLNIKGLELPGFKLNGDEQCRLLYGEEWAYYTGYINDKIDNKPCEAIWCIRGSYVKSPNCAPLQGTSCDQDKVCYRGSCTADYPGSSSVSSTQQQSNSSTLSSTQQQSNFSTLSSTQQQSNSSTLSSTQQQSNNSEQQQSIEFNPVVSSSPPFLPSTTTSQSTTTSTTSEQNAGSIPMTMKDLCNFLKSFGIIMSYCV